LIPNISSSYSLKVVSPENQKVEVFEWIAFLNEPKTFTIAQKYIEQNNSRKGKLKARYLSISIPGNRFCDVSGKRV